MTYTNQSAAETQLGQQSGGNATANMTQSPSAGFVAGGVGGAQATQLSITKLFDATARWWHLNRPKLQLQSPKHF
jgi:hypothetical protein